MADQILVPFRGAGSGVEELTWGQKGIWQTIVAAGESKTMSGVDVLPPGKTVDDAIATLRFVLNRHQALRTRFRFEPDGRVLQVLSESGEAPLEIVDAGPDEDPAAVAAAVRDDYRRRNFDYEHEWPVRMAVVRKDGALTHAVVVYLHTVLDAHGLDILMEDLANMGGAEEDAAPEVMQPLELARRQQTPAAQRQCDASLRHLENVLRTVPARRFGAGNGDPEPAFEMVGYTSPATMLAMRAIAARNSVDSSPVLLAAFAVALVRITGNNPFVTMLAVSNRFRPGLARSVMPVAQISPCVVDVADITLNEAVGRAWHGAMSAYKHAYYDPPQRMALIDAVNRERGEDVDLSCFFNDRREQDRDRHDGEVPTEQQILDALADSELRWEGPVPTKQKLYLDVNDAPGAVDFTVSADLRYVSRELLQELVRGMEAVVVETALHPEASTGVAAPVAVGSR